MALTLAECVKGKDSVWKEQSLQIPFVYFDKKVDMCLGKWNSFQHLQQLKKKKKEQCAFSQATKQKSFPFIMG